MISIFDYYKTKKFLKCTRETLELLDESDTMYFQIKAQEYITEKELEYHKERSFKFLIICAIVVLTFSIFYYFI